VHAGSIPAVVSARLRCAHSVARFAKQSSFVIGALARGTGLFPGSSVVEQPAVNRLVAGSNPARGATLNQALRTRQATLTGGLFADLATALATTCRVGIGADLSRRHSLLMWVLRRFGVALGVGVDGDN
jgi:hypothetical protein